MSLDFFVHDSYMVYMVMSLDFFVHDSYMVYMVMSLDFFVHDSYMVSVSDSMNEWCLFFRYHLHMISLRDSMNEGCLSICLFMTHIWYLFVHDSYMVSVSDISRDHIWVILRVDHLYVWIVHTCGSFIRVNEWHLRHISPYHIWVTYDICE